MTMIAANLDAAIRAVCPIDGVAIGDLADKTTWRVDFAPDATGAQKTAAQAVISGFDINAPEPATVLSQDLMAQFTADDAAKIQAAVAGNVQFWLLWQSLTTQKDPMIVGNPRFLAGWNALIQVLGKPRMDAIATALGVTVA